LAQLRVPAPKLDEQAIITDLLDRETAKIDALVADYRTLIELLQEKRQAVISHAVTKGLDPSVPMKDSGVEWLGEVPEHWVVLTMQRCVAVAEGQVDPRESPYIDMLLIAPNHVESGTGKILEFETAAEQGADSGKYLCDAGSVVYSKIRPALRKVCIAPQACLCSADMYPLQGRCGLSNFFLLWVILSEQFSSLAVLESDRVAMPKINRESLKAVRIPMPPMSEQHNISSFLADETAGIDSLITDAQEAITLLQERRTALISAAVTGKIDVRGLVAIPENELVRSCG
jgi:type I restriction enzyme S subunit